jgi:hypothetical protein
MDGMQGKQNRNRESPLPGFENPSAHKKTKQRAETVQDDVHKVKPTCPQATNAAVEGITQYRQWPVRSDVIWMPLGQAAYIMTEHSAEIQSANILVVHDQPAVVEHKLVFERVQVDPDRKAKDEGVTPLGHGRNE